MRLSSDDVHLILTSSESGCSMARRFGISKQAISQIRLGRTYRTVSPEVARRAPAKSCTSCRFWRSGMDPCSQGIPDVISEGPAFAADCDFFDQRPHRKTKVS